MEVGKKGGKTVGNGSKEGAGYEEERHLKESMHCRLCNGVWLVLTADMSTLSLLGKGRGCNKAAASDWKVWHFIENRSCWPAQCWVSKGFLFP